jgi:hypothetical protein
MFGQRGSCPHCPRGSGAPECEILTDKLSLVGMQLPEKYTENFKISTFEIFFICFSASCIPGQRKLVIIGNAYTLAQSV